MRKAIIVDIDGTIAQKHPDRNIYDLTKVHMDLPNEPVMQVIKFFLRSKTYHSTPGLGVGGGKSNGHYTRDYDIIFVSGREDKAQNSTQKWLIENLLYDVNYFLWKENALFMRKAGDNRCDTIIKREIYEEHIKGKYDVVAVFDDRPKVIRMWRSLGLFVFNCAQHDEEF